jgi:sorbitol-specific phosphotransferase system component IIC
MGSIILAADSGLPGPPPLVADIDPRILLGIFVILVAAALTVAFRFARANRDPLPIVCCLAALVAALNEPIYDILGKIVYAEDNPMAYHAFGRSIPWFLVLGYLPWVGLAPYLVYKAMEAGVARRTLHIAAAVLFVSVMCVEIFGNTLHLWTYYGEVPMKYLGVAPQAVTYPMVGGFLLYALAGGLRGWRRAAVGFVITLVILPIGYAATSWPGYFALYSDLPPAVDWFASAVLLALCAAMAAAGTYLGERWRIMSEGVDAPVDVSGSAPTLRQVLFAR